VVDVGMRLYASDGAIDGATACGEMIHRKLLELADLLAIVLSTLDLHFFQSQTFWFNTVGRFFPAITITSMYKNTPQTGEREKRPIICLVQRVFHQYEWLQEGK